MGSRSKFDNDYKLLILFIHQENTCKTCLHSNSNHLDWLSQFYNDWKQTSKLVNLKISAKVRLSDFGQNLKMTKTS